jgi:hypothetical protein
LVDSDDLAVGTAIHIALTMFSATFVTEPHHGVVTRSRPPSPIRETMPTPTAITEEMAFVTDISGVAARRSQARGQSKGKSAA